MTIETQPTTTASDAAPKGRPASRRARRVPRWLPLAVSGVVHLVLAGVLIVVVAAAPSEEPPVLQLQRLHFTDPVIDELDPTDDTELCEDEPCDTVEIDPFVEPLETPLETPLEESIELPEIEFDDAVSEPPLLAAHEVPLRVIKPRTPKPPENAAVPAERPVSPPIARPVSKPPTVRARPAAKLRLLSRPNLMRYYPAEARRRGVEGEALVEIVVDAEGKVTDARLIRSSGSDLLDRQALRVMYAYRFAQGAGGRARVPVAFRLR